MSTRAADAARWRQQVSHTPHDAVAWHNLAAAEGDVGRSSASEAAARRAIALGLPAAETRLVLARALQSLGRLDDAMSAFDDALRRKPAYADAHRDFAQLVWMRTGSSARALERIDAAVARSPRDTALHLVRAIALEFAGDRAAALDASNVGLAHAPDDVNLLLRTAHLEAEFGDAERALAHAQRAQRGNAKDRADIACCEALLALGRFDDAHSILAPLARALPDNQYVIALQATAWRLAGDPRYRTLYDYDRLVATRALQPPAAWKSLESFIADVVTELDQMHRFVAPPFEQSVRGGGQLTFSEDDLRRPLIGALFQSIGVAVQTHLQALGTGTDAMRARNTGRAAFTGAWSVRLSSGGSHVDHVHPRGWLSSACYLSLPSSIGNEPSGSDDPSHGSAGWLRLGRPGIRTSPPLAAERHVRPEPGLLALFPAYMWHGVEPFDGTGPRLSVAFDVIPG